MYIEKNRGPYFYHTDCFQTISITLMFPFDYDKKDFIKRNMVHDVINRSINFKEKKDFNKALIDNYIIGLNSYHCYIGNTSYMQFDLIIPNPKVIKNVSLEKCFAFFSDLIYKPFIKDNGFEEDEVNRQIDLYKKGIEERKNLIANYASKRIFEIGAPNTKLSESIEKNIGEIKEINGKSLYEFYKKTVINNTPFVFVMGDTNKEEIKALSDKYFFKTDKQTLKISSQINYFLNPTKFESICEDKEFFQSYISLIYKVKDMKEEDRIVLSAINNILNSSASSLLFDKLRTENDLVYTCGAILRNRYGFLSLNALINKKSKEKAILVMKEVIELLKDEDFIKPLLENIKNKERINMIKDKDKKHTLLIEYFIDTILEFSISPEEYYNKLCDVSAKDIKDVAKRLCLCNEFFVRGIKDAR